MAKDEREPAEGTVIIRGDGHEYRVPVHDGVAVLPKEVGYASGHLKTAAGFTPIKAESGPNLAGLKGAPEYGPSEVTRRLVAALGNNATAALLGVNKDRPGRWIAGEDTPSEANRARLADLDALVGHLLSALTPAQARLWLEGQNAHLGARPIDVFRLRGSAPVIEALHAHEQGAFA
jgi:hypothetical protein